MQTAARLLACGDWVHVFPEGRVGYSGRVQPCKWGVGKLVCDCIAESGRCDLLNSQVSYMTCLLYCPINEGAGILVIGLAHVGRTQYFEKTF